MPMRLRFRNPFASPLRLRRRMRRMIRRITWKRALTWLAWAIGALVVVTALLFAWYARDLPTPAKIQSAKPVQATQIFDRNGQPLYAVFGDQKRILITSDQIPTIVKHATVAIEDRDFYKHHGIDVRSIIRAAWNDLRYYLHIGRTNNLEGGSTITQQYVKNALLSPQRSLDRKIEEAILSIEVEFIYSKDEILTHYVNEIPYGSNAYGIEAAAQTFFGKSAKDLTLAEAATLAALPQRPTYLSPYGNHTGELDARRKLVLKDMAAQGYITAQEEQDAAGTKVAFIPRQDQIAAPHFVFYVRDLLIEKYGEQLVNEGGLKVTTTLDRSAQKAAEDAVQTAAQKYLPKYKADNAALVAIDPQTGQILAMVGSADYFDTAHQGNFNVTTAARQPGSSFKPIVYATAFKGNWSPAATLWDVPTDFGHYAPQNFDGKSRGPVNIRAALANSLNIPAVKMLSLVGLDHAIDTARDFGITTLTDPSRYGLALVLGGADVKPLEMAGAYGVFAAGGVYHPSSAILKVEDSQGHVLESWKDQPKEVLPAESAYEITSILTDNAARTPIFGGHSALYFPDRTVAAKTGTTQDFRDGWTIGYTPGIAAAVWVGNNDYSPMNRVDGVQTAAPIFHTFIETYYGSKDSGQFSRPSTMTDVTVDSLSGKLPTQYSPQTITEAFAPWQVPKNSDDIHVAVNVNKANGKLATDLTPPDLVEQRTYTVIRSERPDNPAWEQPVMSWAQDHGYNLSAPPTEKDDTTSDSWPTILLTSPAANAAVSGPFNIVAQPSAKNGIRQVDFSIDGVGIGTRTAAPWQASYNAANLTSGHHEVMAQVTDSLGATAKVSLVIVAVADTTSPGPVSGATATALAGGSIRLAWQNPADADLAKVRIYRSTASGSLGTLVTEVAASPSQSGTATLAGQSAGATYYFTLRPVDQTGNENQSPSQVSAMAL